MLIMANGMNSGYKNRPNLANNFKKTMINNKVKKHIKLKNIMIEKYITINRWRLIINSSRYKTNSLSKIMMHNKMMMLSKWMLIITNGTNSG